MTLVNSIRPRILTVGTGAVGATYSWRLSKTSHITAVCRSNYEAVKQNGFDITSAKFGKGIFRPDHVIRSVCDADSAKNPFDYILVTTKAVPECYNVADVIAPAVTKDATIVLLQNGLGIEDPIVKKFPNNPIVSIVSYIGTSQVEPGKIVMGGRETLIFGKYLAAKRDSDKQRELLIELFRQGDCDVQVVDDVERARWQKLFWNSVFSPICTMTGMTTTELMNNKEAVALSRKLMADVINAAIANGHDFDLEEQMNMMITRTETTASNYKPSMQLDRERSNPMEVEVILGTPLRRAKAKGLDVPYLEQMYSLCSAANALILQNNKQNRQ